MRAIKLSDLCDIRSGGTPSRSRSEFFNGPIPWVKISDIESSNGRIHDTEESITEAGLKAIGGRIFPPETLLFAIYGSIGKMAFLERSASTNQAILGIELRDKDRLSLEYLYNWLNSLHVQLLADGRGIAQKNLSAHYIRNLEIPLPPLDEQRRIATILDQADALRHKRREALALLAHLERAKFIDSFGAPETNPNKLPIVNLGELIIEGPTNGLYKPATEYGSGTPILRIGDFYDGRVTDLSRLRRLRANEKEQNTYALRENDVIINRVNSREYLGKSALVPRLLETTVFESNMMKIRLDPNKINPVYCISYLQSPFVKQQILRNAKDAINQSSINQADVRSLKVLLPPIEAQRAFAETIQQAERASSKQQAHLAQLDALFATLQHRAFRGEL